MNDRADHIFPELNQALGLIIPGLSPWLFDAKVLHDPSAEHPTCLFVLLSAPKALLDCGLDFDLVQCPANQVAQQGAIVRREFGKGSVKLIGDRPARAELVFVGNLPPWVRIAEFDRG